MTHEPAVKQTPAWRLEDIDLGAVDLEAARADEALVLLLAAASFVESAAHVYAANLVRHFEAHPGVARWLVEQWEPEELQHGRALRAYVELVWPDYRWERAYEAFFAEYRALCGPQALEPRPALELAARCVVETGTATLYRAIARQAREPVLRALAEHISRDEVGHYRHFYRYFREQQAAERNSRLRVLRVLLDRVLEERVEDAECGLRHAFAERRRGHEPDHKGLAEASARIRKLVRSAYPYEMAARMLLRPLALPAAVRAVIKPPLVLGARWLILG